MKKMLIIALVAILLSFAACSAPSDTSGQTTLVTEFSSSGITGPPGTNRYYSEPEGSLADGTGSVDATFDLQSVEYVLLSPVTENGVTRCERERTTNLPYWEFIYDLESGWIFGMIENRTCVPSIGTHGEALERVFLAIDRKAIGDDLAQNYSLEFGGNIGMFIISDGRLAINSDAAPVANVTGVWTHEHEQDFDSIAIVPDKSVDYVRVELLIGYGSTRCLPEEATDLPIREFMYDLVHGIFYASVKNGTCRALLTTSAFNPYGSIFLAIDLATLEEQLAEEGLSFGGERGKYLWKEDTLVLNQYAEPATK